MKFELLNKSPGEGPASGIKGEYSKRVNSFAKEALTESRTILLHEIGMDSGNRFGKRIQG